MLVLAEQAKVKAYKHMFTSLQVQFRQWASISSNMNFKWSKDCYVKHTHYCYTVATIRLDINFATSHDDLVTYLILY